GTTLTLTGTGLDAAAAAGGLTVTVGGKACAVTSVTPTSATCTVPASTTGPADVAVSVGGTLITTFAGGYTYSAHGTLQVTKRAWVAVPDSGLTGADLYNALVTGTIAATEVPVGGQVPPGTPVTWTYTVTYVYLVDGVPYGGAADLGAGDVAVTDDDDTISTVCTGLTLYLNTPTGCVAAGVV
ncbi:MAG: IPT/TIG domain-containing protein, partial [Propionibacteriaceae bacterium]|nr:IPT/TIG domain-containing protein [Propionibacteriaceae bacterium]